MLIARVRIYKGRQHIAAPYLAMPAHAHILPFIAVLLPFMPQKRPLIRCWCVGSCVVFGCAIVHLSKASAKAKGAKVKGLQILAVVAIVTGFVWAGIGIIGQNPGVVQLSAIIAVIGMFAAVLSVLFIEE